MKQKHETNDAKQLTFSYLQQFDFIDLPGGPGNLFMQSVAKYREKIAFLKSWQDFQMLFVMKGLYVFNDIY